MLFTKTIQAEIAETFHPEVTSSDVMESVNDAIFEARMFDYEYNHDIHNVEMVAIEAYKNYNGQEALLESQLETITEGFFAKVWDKIKSFLKMIWNGIVKAVTKLLEWLHLKKKKIEEEEQSKEEIIAQAEAEDDRGLKENPPTTETPKADEKPDPKAQEEAPKTEEPPKNMSQAIQQQEAKKPPKDRSGHYSSRKPESQPKQAYQPKGGQKKRPARKISKNIIVIQESYVEINGSADKIEKWEKFVLEVFKRFSNLMKEMAAGKRNLLIEHIAGDKEAQRTLGKTDVGYGNRDSWRAEDVRQLALNAIGMPNDKFIVPFFIDNIENNGKETALNRIANGDLKEKKNTIKRTIENERKLRKDFINRVTKVVDKSKLSVIKKSCDDTEKAIENIGKKPDNQVNRQSTVISKVAYNIYRISYLNQLWICYVSEEIPRLSEKAAEEAASKYQKAA